MLSLLLILAVPHAPAEFFEKSVRPVLVEQCLKCHGPAKQRGGLRVDSREALLKGGDSGPALVPGKPAASLLLKAVRHDGLRMPPKPAAKLAPQAAASLEAWIAAGAVWPADKGPASGPSSVDIARKAHWAFRPVARPAMPANGAGSPIDRFLLARLEKRGLGFSAPADRRTYVRRVTLGLTGLPPTPQETEAFLADHRPDAFERLVDRLLASPAYGEKWARHWLDVARYADTKGYVFTEERRYPYAWTYRDWVAGAFNEDLPYDRFLVQQLAADLVPGHEQRSLAAMGFLTLGRRFLNNIHDIIDDRIDVTARGLMGLTVACARCHDHKFDPIPTRDYYSLHGVFASSIEPAELPLLPDAGSPFRKAFDDELAKRQQALQGYLASQRPVLVKRYRAQAGEYMAAASKRGRPPQGMNGPMVQRWRQWLAQKRKSPFYAAWFAAKDKQAEAKKYAALFADGKHDAEGPFAFAGDIRPYLDRAQRDRATGLKRTVDAWNATGRGAPPRAMALADAARPTDPRVLLRGNPGSPGVAVPRQFLEILSQGRKPFTKGSGRLEMAQAIVSPDNPLTARVMANRVWMHHFGKGIVGTPGNFGLRGDAPSHPALLDWLASEFVEGGWSVKRLQRSIVLSAAYRQSSAERAEALAKDPENVLLWRMNRRRLEFEPLRDSLLAASGLLDRQMGGPSVDIAGKMAPRRTVYAFIERQNLPGVFRTFDLASPDASTPQRYSTTVPQQALYLMNSPFMQATAKAFASRADVVGLDDEARIERMHRLAYGRDADREEIALGLAFVRGPREPGTGLTGWEQYAQVLLLANEFSFAD